MSATPALAAGSAVVATAFTLCLAERWLTRRRRHDLAWATALALFTVGALGLCAGASLGWDGWSFRLFYAFGAVLNVPFLALGSIYLLAGTGVGDRVAAVLVPSAGFALGIVLVAPFTAPVGGAALPQGSDVFGPAPRILAAVASGAGATVVFGGAAWSTVRLLRGGGPRRPAAGNALIAAGTVVLSASGLLNSTLGEMDGFAVTLALGVTLLFGGFLVASMPPARHLRVVADKPATVSVG